MNKMFKIRNEEETDYERVGDYKESFLEFIYSGVR